MILIDTHVWIWWVQGDKQKLTVEELAWLDAQKLGISIISCWEVAKLTENHRLQLPCKIDEWLAIATRQPNLQLFDLTIATIINACQLPQPFHRDPADQLIVATARE